MKLPRAVVDACREMEHDRLSGAHDLARLASVALAGAATEATVVNAGELIDLLRISAASLARVRPAMGAIANAVAELFVQIEQAVGSSDDLKGTAEQVAASYLLKLDRALAETARQTAGLVPSDAAVMTTSLSRTVVDALRQASPRKVVVCESRPAMEGRQTAHFLGEAGLSVEFVSDAAAPGLVREVDLVLVGADTVLADGAVVNKVGSYAIALAAREAKVPFDAACESLKISPLHSMPPEPHDPQGLWADPPPNVVVRNAYFELVRPELVHSIATEVGVLLPSEAARIAAGKRRALRAIGVT